MATFATVSDLASGWRTMSADEEKIAGVLLERASAALRIQIGAQKLTADQYEVAKYIVCDVVRKSFFGETLGETPILEGATPMTWEQAAEGGALNITEKHLKMLGLSRTKAGFVGHSSNRLA